MGRTSKGRGLDRSKIKGYGTAAAKRAYADYIEYNCMNPACEFMWDQSQNSDPTELCPRCGSNDLHSAPRPPQLRFNEGIMKGYTTEQISLISTGGTSAGELP